MTPDAAYRALFSHAELVRDLLIGYAAPEWFDELDFDTLESAATVFVADELRERRSDIIWRLRWRGSTWLYIYVLLEFQSQVDRLMPIRLLAYVALLYQDLDKAGQLQAGLLPPVLPVVLYNGERRWRAPVDTASCIAPGPDALSEHIPHMRMVLLDEPRMRLSDLAAERNLATAVFALEQSRSVADIKRVVDALADWLHETPDAAIRRSYAEWVGQVLLPARLPAGDEEATIITSTLDGVQSMLADRVKGWVEDWKQQGLREGRVDSGINGHSVPEILAGSGVVVGRSKSALGATC